MNGEMETWDLDSFTFRARKLLRARNVIAEDLPAVKADADSDADGRWRLFNYNHWGRRIDSANGPISSRLHLRDDSFAHALLPQPDDFVRAQVVDRAGSANLVDDNPVTDVLLSHRGDVRDVKLPGFGGGNAFLLGLLLVHVIADRAADQAAGNSADGRARAGVVRRAADQTTGDSAYPA